MNIPHPLVWTSSGGVLCLVLFGKYKAEGSVLGLWSLLILLKFFFFSTCIDTLRPPFPGRRQGYLENTGGWLQLPIYTQDILSESLHRVM